MLVFIPSYANQSLSNRWVSNPLLNLGKVAHYHCATIAFCEHQWSNNLHTELWKSPVYSSTPLMLICKFQDGGKSGLLLLLTTLCGLHYF